MSIQTVISQPNVSQLPATYVIALSDLSAISLVGQDQCQYLQGQVTCDVNSVNEHSLTHGAHCDAKGKVLSVFRLIERNSRYLLIQPKTSIALSLAALQKFGVFAKVEIEQASQLSFYALVGEQATQVLQQQFNRIPDSLTPVIQAGSTTLVYIAGETTRYLLIDESCTVEQLATDFNLALYSHDVWNLLEITEGFPVLAQESVEQYVPQMLNLQAINGISFTKGCYLGQETVARMQYLGKNKRALFRLNSTGTVDTDHPKIVAGDIIEKQLGDNWRKAGDVLSAYVCQEEVNIQAVLASDVEQSTVFRLKSTPELQFSLVDLPYSLNQED